MRFPKIHIILIILFGISGSGFGQSLSGIPASFVDIGFGTRPVGMGYAFVGLADDENATYWNPAGLALTRDITAGFSQIDQLGLITYNYASVAVPLPGQKHTLGITAISSGDDALEELSFHLGYGFKVNILSLGLAVKYRHASFGNNTLNREDYIVFDDSEIDEALNQQVFGDASGLGIDLGLMLHPTSRLSFGVLVRDLYAPMNWNSEARGAEYQARGSYEENLPFEVLFGTAYKLSNNFIATVDFQPATTNERTNFVRAGIEGRLVKVLMIRAGTEQGVNDLDDEKFTLGTGIDLKVKNQIRIKSDFAYVIEPLQNSQRISVTISF